MNHIDKRRRQRQLEAVLLPSLARLASEPRAADYRRALGTGLHDAPLTTDLWRAERLVLAGLVPVARVLIELWPIERRMFLARMIGHLNRALLDPEASPAVVGRARDLVTTARRAMADETGGRCLELA